MRASMLVLVTAAFAPGCVDGGIDDGADRSGDAALLDTAADDARDGPGGSDSGLDTMRVADSMVTPVDADAEASAKDSAPPANVGACKTTCGGAECGPVPNGCGGTLACGDCGGAPGEYCQTVDAPLFRTGVHNAIEALAATAPSYLDVTDVVGGNYRVKDGTAFVNALVAEMMKKGGLLCIPDPLDGNEIRIRPDPGDAAENYHVIISSGYTAYKYTSTCTPAGF